MSFTPSFAYSQTLGYPGNINFTDTSTGSDSNITGRRIYIQIAGGTFLVPNGIDTQYNEWPLANTSITLINVLSKDYATITTVQWIDVDGNVLYDSQQLIGFTLFNEQFSYQLSQQLTGNPLNVNDNNFFETRSELRDCIDSGNQAINFFSDLYNAQQCYDRGTEIRINSVYYFNSNS